MIIIQYFKRILDKLEFYFIPVYSLTDNKIFGYKIIKDFTPVGYNDKDFMYQMAFEEGIFEDFIFQLIKKAYTLAIEKGISDKYLFYTLRMNFISDKKNFFIKINDLVKDLNLDSEKIIFDIKYIDNWYSFIQEVGDKFPYKNILKELRNESLNLQSVENIHPYILEVRTIENLLFLKEKIPQDIKFIFNIATDESITLEYLKKIGVNYFYSFSSKDNY